MCVRLDRRAVYLGTPGAEPALPRRRDRPAAGDPGRPGARARAAAARAQRRAAPRPAHLSAASAFTGLGFDACAAPSARTMSAWASSPYRAIGVYIGGVNRGCSQPNLTAELGRRTGRRRLAPDPDLRRPAGADQRLQQLRQAQLRAPATAQGTAAAERRRRRRRRASGSAPGSPIYFDMEGYTRTSAPAARRSPSSPPGPPAARARLRLRRLQQQRLGHRRPRRPRSAAATSCPTTSGSPTGTASANTLDPYVPSSAWARHQRIHQYRGGHDETYGGVTINIDNDYVEGATVGAGLPGAEPKGRLDSVAASRPGQVTISRLGLRPERADAAAGDPRLRRARREGQRGAPYELGPIADQDRSDVAVAHRAAGPSHGVRPQLPGRSPAAGSESASTPLGVARHRTGARLPRGRHPRADRGLRTSRRRGGRCGSTLSCQWPAGDPVPGPDPAARPRPAVRRVRRGRRRS